jgi:hypothetical protein
MTSVRGYVENTSKEERIQSKHQAGLCKIDTKNTRVLSGIFINCDESYIRTNCSEDTTHHKKEDEGEDLQRKGKIGSHDTGTGTSQMCSDLYRILILDIPVGLYMQKYISLLPITQSQPTNTPSTRNQAIGFSFKELLSGL